jgi:hypothetical protein
MHAAFADLRFLKLTMVNVPGVTALLRVFKQTCYVTELRLIEMSFSLIKTWLAESSCYIFNALKKPKRTACFISLCIVIFLLSENVRAQDSTLLMGHKVVTLKEVIVHNNLDAAKFIKRVQEDSTFYKAFKNLKILGYTALNDIRMFDRKSRQVASLQSRTRQTVQGHCRWMETIQENTTGDIYTKDREFNYYTAEMYAGLFFAQDTICGENNIVGKTSFSNKGKSGLAKHKEQLKMLFFNPGKRIPGIPFIGDKIAIFEGDAAELYDFVIDIQELKGELCYVFSAVAREDLKRSEKDRVVINEIITWFRMTSWEILARNYSLSYRAGVYDFDVQLEVELGHHGELLVPKVMRYNGNWDVVFKKRERGVFTATLFDFK